MKDTTNRRSKDSPSSKCSPIQSKKLHKIEKKNLNSAFASVSEEILNDSATDSPNLSAISEVSSDNNLIIESSDDLESCLSIENQSSNAPDEAVKISEITPSSTITSINGTNNFSVDRNKEFRSNDNVEVDVVLNLLKEARDQVSRSNDVSVPSKKYLDALVDVYMRELCVLPDEGDAINAVLSKRFRVVMICFAVWVISLAMIMFRWSGTRSSFSFDYPPT